MECIPEAETATGYNPPLNNCFEIKKFQHNKINGPGYDKCITKGIAFSEVTKKQMSPSKSGWFEHFGSTDPPL